MLAVTDVRRYTCSLCDERYQSRSALHDHLKGKHTGPESPLWNTILTFKDRSVCGNCGKESSHEGLKRHIVDKPDRNHPFSTLEELDQLDQQPLRNYIANETTELRCEICGRIRETEDALGGEPCRSSKKHTYEIDIADEQAVSVTDVLSLETPRLDDLPDSIAETLIETDHSYVRIGVLGGTLSVPAEAYTATTHDVQLSSFCAYVHDATEEDCGYSFMGILKISKQIAKQLQIHNVGENNEPISSIDIWASRPELGFKNDLRGYGEAPTAKLLSAIGVSDGGPYIHHLKEAIEEDRSVSPLNPPKLEIHYPISEPPSQSYTHTHSRYSTETIGQIASVEPVSRCEVPDYAIVAEKPERKGPEPPYMAPFASHPTIGWDTLDPLEPTERIIEALYTINKYAKEEAENGTKCYRNGKKARAKVHSVRKTALYAVKSVAIHRLVKADPDNVTVKKHEIDDQEFWCFYFEAFDQSFHQPVEAVVSEVITTIEAADGRVESEDVVEIELTAEVPDDLPDLDSALETLAADYGIDANDYLTRHQVTESTGPFAFESVEHSTEFDIDSSS